MGKRLSWTVAPWCAATLAARWSGARGGRGAPGVAATVRRVDTVVREQLEAAGLDTELLAAVERALDEPFEYSVTVYCAGAPAVTHELSSTLEDRLSTLGQLGFDGPFAGVVLREPDAVVVGSRNAHPGSVEVLELFQGELVAGRGVRAAVVAALAGRPQPSTHSYLHRFLLNKALRAPGEPVPTPGSALSETIDHGALSWRVLATAHQQQHLMAADPGVIAAVLGATLPPESELRAHLIAAGAEPVLDAIDAQFAAWTA